MNTVPPEVLEQQRLDRFHKNDATRRQRENSNSDGQSGKLERPQQLQLQHHRQLLQLQSSNTGLSTSGIDSPSYTTICREFTICSDSTFVHDITDKSIE